MPSPTPTATTAVSTSSGVDVGRDRDAREHRVLLAHPLLLLDLLEQVGDADLARAPGLDAGLDRATDVVGVDVAVPEAVATDDDDGVAERGPGPLERRDRRVLGLEQVHHLVAERREVVAGEVGLDRDRRVDDLGLGDRAAGDDLEERVEQQREARAAGVDDAGLLQDREQLGRAQHGVDVPRPARRRARRRAPARPRRARPRRLRPRRAPR